MDGNGKFKDHFDFRKRDRRFFQQQFPNVQAFNFTRPYPYHLDYYKMKWGGSYAPYFGNLYGPPQVVTAPPYYGPYYGNWGYGNGDWGGGGYAPQGYNGFNGGPVGGFNGAPVEQQGFPPGTTIEGPALNSVPADQPVEQPNGEGLPSPGQQ